MKKPHRSDRKYLGQFGEYDFEIDLANWQGYIETLAYEAIDLISSIDFNSINLKNAQDIKEFKQKYPEEF